MSRCWCVRWWKVKKVKKKRIPLKISISGSIKPPSNAKYYCEFCFFIVVVFFFWANGHKIKLILCISIAITVKGFYDRTHIERYTTYILTTAFDGEIEWKIIRRKRFTSKFFRVCIENSNSQNDCVYWQRGIFMYVCSGFKL